MTRHLFLVAIVAGALAAAGCTAMTVSSHVERGLDFQRYYSFEWGPADALPTGDPRLDQNPFFKDHIEGAVEKEMAARGFVRAAADSRPDLLLHYHAVINRRVDVNRIDREYGYCYDEECKARVIEYEAGTLVIDAVDARTNRVVWRGWAQDTVEGVLDNEDRMARQINDAVKRMLARFPGAL